MIGQKDNLLLLEGIKERNELPRFIILTGEPGSGKKTLARYIAKNIIGGYTVIANNGVDAVREIVENCYRCGVITVYLFLDADKMSVQAKNALLKITEEPPKQAYFIMTVEDINNTISTLKSRATEIKMLPYSQEELYEYCKSKNYKNTKLFDIASNIGQIEYLTTIDLDSFYAFCSKVLENIGTVTGVNAMKIGTNFKFKEEATGYDPVIFLNCIMSICLSRVKSATTKREIYEYFQIVRCCIKYKNELRITGVKKESTFDMWILDARDIFKDTR